MSIKQNILSTLTYFDLFNYPLKKREVFLFLSNAADNHHLDNALRELQEESAIYKVGEFYSLHDDNSLAVKRNKGNTKAALMLLEADKAAAIISRFPFVKGVAVSGSLSKNFADEDADIDFFIITTSHRLWIARSFLHLFKKFTFLVKKQHFFCMNYFIDESQLTILEKNIYTATEVATLLPLRGNAAFEKFYAANTWTKKILPNNYMRVASAKETKKSWVSSAVEKLLNNRFGEMIDSLLMRITCRRWNDKTRRQKKNSHGMVMGMDAGKHFSKPDPSNFQQKLLRHYSERMAEVLDKYEHSSRMTNELG